MKRHFIFVAAAAALLVGGLSTWAQAPGAGGAAAQGFTVETLISQLSLYLPEEATQGLGGFGGAPGAQGGGAQAGAQGGGAQAGAQAGGQAGRGREFRQLFQFTRDAKLYLTKDQVAKLLPVLQGLRENPLPTPSKAKQVQASVDAILTVAQKAEYAEFQKQMQKAMEEIRKQFSANSAGAGQAGNGTFDRQAEGGQAGAAGGQGRQGAQMTPTERRQRELDAFIKVLQDRQKQVNA